MTSALSLCHPVTARGEGGWPQGVSVSAEGACVMDADSGTILYGKNADTAYYPASITKVMTALLVLENCSDLSEVVTFSQAAVELGEDNATVIGASAGDQLTVRDCLYSLLFKSANEVANALAEHVGAKFPERKESGMSDRDVFVSMMNEKAAALGCTNTHFNNPSGLTDAEHYTTAHDMCLILGAAIKNETFVEIESRTYWTHAPIRRYPDPNDPWNTVYQSHRMIRRNSYYYYPGVFAGKTGFTTTAGNTLVTACRKDGMTLVVTVLNGHMTHYEDTKRLLDFGYANFHSFPVTDYDTTGHTIQQDLSVLGLPLTDAVVLAVDEDSRVTLPKGTEFTAAMQQLDFTLSDEERDANIVAKLHYTYDGRKVGTAVLRSRRLGRDSELSEIREDPLFLALTESSAPEVLPGGEETTGTEEGGKAEALPAETGAPDSSGEPESSEEALSAPAGDEEAKALAEAGAAQEESGAGALNGAEGEKRLIPVLGLRVSPAVMTALKIAAGACGLLLFAGILMFQAEKREAQRRARRRQQRLRHTRDLTGSQNIKMDLMVQQRLRRGNKRRRRRR